MTAEKQIIIVESEGEDYRISDSILMRDYLKSGVIPSTDSLLDWRFRVAELMEEKKFPSKWYKLEIIATDYLLNQLLNKNSK